MGNHLQIWPELFLDSSRSTFLNSWQPGWRRPAPQIPPTAPTPVRLPFQISPLPWLFFFFFLFVVNFVIH